MHLHPSQHDPVERLRAATRRVIRIAVPCAIAMLVWAIWPLWSRGSDVAPPASVIDASAATRPRAAHAPLDVRPFDVALWVPPPAPPTKEVIVAAPPPPPFKLQLLGITGDGTESLPMRAALYDPDTDRVILIKQGDTLSRFTVRALTSDSIELADGPRVERLSLREPAGSSSGAGVSR